MAFSIDNYNQRTLYDFKNRLAGGGARPNLFECDITFPTQALTGEDIDALGLDLRFLIKAAELPGSTIAAISVPFRGRTLKLAGDRTFQPWTITVINDTNFRIRNAFEKWMNYMNRNDDNSGVIDPSVYQKDIKVHQLSRGSTAVGNSTQPTGGEKINIIKSYKLYGAFPTDVGPITLGYDQGDTIEEFTVTLDYQWWDTYKGDDSTTMLDTTEDGTNPNAPTAPPSIVS